MEQVSRELKAIRVKRGLTQEQTAKRLGVATQTYIKHENDPGRFTVKMLSRLAKIFECDTTELLDIFFK